MNVISLKTLRLFVTRKIVSKMIPRVALAIVVFYLAFALALYLIQDSIVYPGHIFQGKSFSALPPVPGHELTHCNTEEGDRIAMIYGEALTPDGRPLPDAANRPALIFFYGNGECMKFESSRFSLFRRLGLNVVIPDYAGYGMSSGKPSEKGCYSAASAAYAFLTERKGFAPNRILVAGWSLGGAVAVDLASRKPVRGLAIFSAFTSLQDVGSEKLPLLPVKWLLRSRFDSESKLSRVSCPVLIGHGERDNVVPFSMMRRLAEAKKTNVECFSVKNAGHNDFFQTGEAKIAEEFKAFLSRLGGD